MVGLSVGAYDYMTKPFNPRKSPRVQAMLRRPRRPGARVLVVTGLTVDRELGRYDAGAI